MIYDDFRTPVWPSDRWTMFRTPEHDLWDPATEIVWSSEPEHALTLHLPRFTQSHPNHVKAMILSTTRFEIERSFIVRAKIAARTSGTESNPFGLESGDPRLAAGALVTMDPQTGMVFDFFVSNDRISPIYERLPTAREALGPYPAFTKLFDPVPTRPGEWHSYEIRYDGDADRTEWWIDGRCVARTQRVGSPVEGNAPVVKVRHLHIGGALFTLLDGIRDEREHAGDHDPIPGFIASNWEDRFGQGGDVSFASFEIEH